MRNMILKVKPEDYKNVHDSFCVKANLTNAFHDVNDIANEGYVYYFIEFNCGQSLERYLAENYFAVRFFSYKGSYVCEVL